MEKKYLKYKNKYLNIKNQKGGSNIEFPKQVFDNFINKTDNCLKSYDFTIDIDKWDKLKNFFNIANTTYKNNFYPNEQINENNFIGKTNFIKEDINKIWSRLYFSDKSNAELIGLYYEHIQNSNSFIKISDFIKIETNKITINTDEYKTDSSNIYHNLYNVIQKIKNKNNNRSVDEQQSSGISFPFEWETYDPSKPSDTFEKFITIFGECKTKGSFNINVNVNINYQHCSNFVIFYRLNNEFYQFIICYVEEDGASLNMFPFGFTNILLNINHEQSIINLFNDIKQQLEIIYQDNLDQNTKIYNQMITEYTENRPVSELQVLFTDDTMKLEDGFESRIAILDMLGLVGDFEYEPDTDNDDFKKSHATELKQITYDILLEFEKKYKPDYYKLLPDKFFHIHLTNASEKYMLLTCHADIEITSDGLALNYTYIDKANTSHKLIRKQISSDLSQKELYQIKKTHNFYVLFNKHENKHYIYGMGNQNDSCLESVFFEFERTTGITEYLFSDIICDINYIDSYGVIIGKSKQKCKFFCTGTDDVKTMDFNNIYGNDKHDKVNNIFNRTNNYYLTDNKMKCAKAKIDSNNTLFIDDILVSWEFKDCNKSIIKPYQMLKKFVEFAKKNKLLRVELDDDAFLQIPTTYYISAGTKFKYSLIYLFKTPETPSIYSSKFHLKNKHHSKVWYTNLIELLKDEVDKYKRLNDYNLYAEANKLLIEKIKYIGDFSKYSNYLKFKNEYEKFDQNITRVLNKFIESNMSDLTNDSDIITILNPQPLYEIKSKLNNKTFSDFTKIIEMDRFYISYLDYDNYLSRSQ